MESDGIDDVIPRTILDVIPNAVIGHFTLSQEILNEAPESIKEALQAYQGQLVTCFAIPITEDSLWVWHKSGSRRFLLANYVLSAAAQSVVEALNHIGIASVEITRLVGQSISMVKLGELSQLGRRGKNNLLLHPEWGAWLQLHAVISASETFYGADMLGAVCIGCDACLDACPVKAVKGVEFYPDACRVVVASPTHRKSKSLALTENSYIECRECVSHCPIGNRSEGILEWKVS